MTSARGRPRSTQADAAVRTAVHTMLGSVGYPSLSIEAVAAEAGISKATIYRRWSSKAEMVFALIIHGADIALPAAPHSLSRDVRALVTHVVGLLSEPSARAALPGLIADLSDDPALAARFHSAVIEPQRRLVDDLLSAAVDRGELAQTPDADVVHARILGAVFTPLFLLAEPPPKNLAGRVSAEILASLQTGQS